MKHPSSWTDKGKKRLFLVLLLAAIGVLILIGWQVGGPILRLAADPEAFRQWIAQRQAGGLLLYGGMVFFQVLFAIIPGEPLEIAGGYAFGALWGTVACLAAATLGSVVVFALVRRFGTRLVEVFFPREKLRRLRFLQSSPRRTFLFFLIFMIPGTPKDLLCYFAGLTDIKPLPFLLICSLGRLPSLVTSTVGGDALGTESYVLAAVVFAVTLLISGAGLLCYRWLCRRHNRAHDQQEAEKGRPPEEK